MAYTKTTWEDLPSTNTPITASNLNNIENQVKTNTDDILDLQNLSLQNKGTIANNTNLNNLTTQGIYYTSNNTFTNTPPINYNWAEIIVISQSVIQQIFIKPVNGSIYIREYSGSSWQAWKCVNLENNWTNITFTSTYWSARSGYEPKYKQIGNVIYLTGQFVPKQNLNALSNYAITTSNLPAPTNQHSFTTNTYGGVVATGWISGNSITIRPLGAIPSTESVGCAIDGCYLIS